MSQEEERYYEQYFALFATDGWKQYIAELQEVLDEHRIEDIKDLQNLYTLKGERAVLSRIVNFESSIRNSYDYLLETDNV